MSPESEKIVAELRAPANVFLADPPVWPDLNRILLAAADHIERLEREKAEAKRQGMREAAEATTGLVPMAESDGDEHAFKQAALDAIRALEESHAE